MQKSFTPLFNEIAKEAHDAFPDELERFVVFLTSTTRKPVYVSPEIAEKLGKGMAGIKNALKSCKKYIRKNRNVLGFAQEGELSGKTVRIITLNGEINAIFSRGHKKKMAAIFVMDHEIGHHIIRNGFSSTPGGTPNLAESAADAYAMLRHIQRFGKNTHYARNHGADGILNLHLKSDTAHYTADAVQRAIEVADEMGDNFFKLSLQQTAKLAADIADDYHLDDETLKKICTVFLPVQQRHYKILCGLNIYNALRYEKIMCGEILSIMAKHPNEPDILKAGRRLLDSPQFAKAAAKANPRPGP